MNDLSKMVYRATKGEIRIDDLTEDAAGLGSFELSAEEKEAVHRNIQSGQWTEYTTTAIGGWI